jgi:hypothetical protein
MILDLGEGRVEIDGLDRVYAHPRRESAMLADAFEETFRTARGSPPDRTPETENAAGSPEPSGA